jgi:cytochrome c-type biogenesis protein CcmH/NrfG
VVLSALVVCSLLAVALATLDPTGLFGNDEEDQANWEDPNADVIGEQQTAVARNPDDVEALTLLANMLGNTGRINEAVPLYEKAVTLAPDDLGIRVDFARTLSGAGLNGDAEAQFRVVLERDPDSQAAHYYLAELLQQSDPPRTHEAIEHFRRVVEIDPTAFLAEKAQGKLTMLTAGTPAASGTAMASPEATPTP